MPDEFLSKLSQMIEPNIGLPIEPFYRPQPISQTNPAAWMYERIVRSIIDFEKKLDSDQEIGARLVSFSSGETIHIDDVGYWGPDIIKFYGRNVDGRPVELMQHISQMSVLLVSVKAEQEKPRRIGFILEQRLKTSEG